MVSAIKVVREAEVELFLMCHVQCGVYRVIKVGGGDENWGRVITQTEPSHSDILLLHLHSNHL